ncbi:MAG: flagellar hook-length control protein FliK [Alphaproteobacteria bacterium]|nr:flagellar hook-length control protein FliK [Alphaproteobacteria bacterium]
MLAAAMVPPLPIEAGQTQFPELALDDLSSSLVAPTDTGKLTIPATDLTRSSLPGTDANGLAADRQLEQTLKSALETDREPTDNGNIEPVSSTSSAQVVAKAAVAEPETVRRPATNHVPEALAPRNSDEMVAGAAVGEPEPVREPSVPREETRQTGPAPLAVSRASETADLGPAAEPDGLKSSASGLIDMPPAGEQSVPSGLRLPEGEGAHNAKSRRTGHTPSAEEAIGVLAQSDVQGLAPNVPSATISTLNAAPGSPASVEVRLNSTQTDVASSPAAVSRMTETLTGIRGLDRPSIPPTPGSGAFEVLDLTSAREGLGSGDTAGLSIQGTSAIAVAGAAPAAVQPNSIAASVPTVMSPSNAILVASPAEVAGIVSSAADNGESDRIVIQLDPPELGRVSIDFKFDANGLQHVTVTGETPDALRQLRLMHFELTQALERHGLGSQNMTFQQQHQNAQQSPAPNPFLRQGLLSDAGGASTLDPLIANISQTSPRTLPGGRLDMKL